MSYETVEERSDPKDLERTLCLGVARTSEKVKPDQRMKLSPEDPGTLPAKAPEGPSVREGLLHPMLQPKGGRERCPSRT